MVERRKSKAGRREFDAHECPVENCGEVSELIKKNKTLSKRVTYVGSVSLVILGLVVTVLLALANQTLNIAQNSSEHMKGFIDNHDMHMLDDAKVRSSTMAQLNTMSTQLKTVSEIQFAVVQEVSILKKSRVTGGAGP